VAVLKLAFTSTDLLGDESHTHISVSYAGGQSSIAGGLSQDSDSSDDEKAGEGSGSDEDTISITVIWCHVADTWQIDVP
jgi:hypothetical protein